MRRIPHLIHVGYPKAGSTFLQKWFERHPDLHYAPEGIAGFRDVYQVCREPATSHRCHVTSCEGLSAPNGNRGALREDSVREVLAMVDRIKENQAEVCRTLRCLFPGSSILIVTRGFMSIAKSGYSQYVRTGGTLTFRELHGRLAGVTSTDAHDPHDFDYLIGLYRAAFGHDNVIVLPYELLRDDTRRFIAVLEERLQLQHADIDIGRMNPSLSPEELYWYPRVSRIVRTATSRMGRVGKRISRWYGTRVFAARLRPLVHVLSWVTRGRKTTDADFPPDAMLQFRGNADLLRDDPLYAPYAADYLWQLPS
jgi:hypothetical protein